MFPQDERQSGRAGSHLAAGRIEAGRWHGHEGHSFRTKSISCMRCRKMFPPSIWVNELDKRLLVIREVTQ
jgi:hypothetical protein